MNFKLSPKLRDIICILLGTALLASAINLVYDPLGLVTGGVTGLAIIIKDLTSHIFPGGIPVWLTNTLINLPLFLVALRMKGKKYLVKTFSGFLGLTFFLYLIPVQPITGDDLLVAAVLGAILTGTGMGLVFLSMASTGGTDLLATLIHEKKKYYSMPRILAVIDGCVVVLGAFVFGIQHAVYAIIIIFIASKISDALIDGMKFAKVAFIISDHYEEIAKEIMHGLSRGVTSLDITGFYSKQQKKMLYCVVSKKEIVELTEIVHKHDTRAFITVSDAREVMGEGFIDVTKQAK